MGVGEGGREGQRQGQACLEVSPVLVFGVDESLDRLLLLCVPQHHTPAEQAKQAPPPRGHIRDGAPIGLYTVVDPP